MEINLGKHQDCYTSERGWVRVYGEMMEMNMVSENDVAYERVSSSYKWKGYRMWLPTHRLTFLICQDLWSPNVNGVSVTVGFYISPVGLCLQDITFFVYILKLHFWSLYFT